MQPHSKAPAHPLAASRRLRGAQELPARNCPVPRQQSASCKSSPIAQVSCSSTENTPKTFNMAVTCSTRRIRKDGAHPPLTVQVPPSSSTPPLLVHSWYLLRSPELQSCAENHQAGVARGVLRASKAARDQRHHQNVLECGCAFHISSDPRQRDYSCALEWTTFHCARLCCPRGGSITLGASHS